MNAHTIPVGGSTGIDHADNPQIDECARYLATTPPHARPTPLVPHLRDMFGLTSVECCEAIRQSHLIIARAH